MPKAKNNIQIKLPLFVPDKGTFPSVDWSLLTKLCAIGRGSKEMKKPKFENAESQKHRR
jgi:hypothetical protein